MLEKTTKYINSSSSSHLWCLSEDQTEILVAYVSNHEKIHAEVFGDFAWDEPVRGYVFEKQGIVTVHGTITKRLLKMLEKTLDFKGITVCYYRGELEG